MKAVLSYPGSKWNLAKWIINHIPPHTTYLEPFFGSGAVFFNKTPSKTETINDIDDNVVNLFQVIRDQPQELIALIEMTPWARHEYLISFEKTGDALEDARRFLIRCWQAFASPTYSKPGWRNDINALKYSSLTSTWKKLPVRILNMVDRLKNAQIDNQPALKIIERYHSKNVLIYADPPYPAGTKQGKKLYKYEMTDFEHIQLLDTLNSHPGPVLLSGYACSLYDKRLKSWTRHTIQAQNGRGRKKEEVLWVNPVASKSR